MDELDFMPDEWPEGWGDIAKAAIMPHTIPLTLAQKVLSRGRGSAGKVVTHTQPPPIASNAREVQGQLTGLLRTVKAVEQKLDDTTRQLAVLQRASSGNNDAERFQQALTSSVLGAAPLLEQRNFFGVAAHLAPILQSGRGASAAIATKPVSTLLWPAAALGAFALREPRKPVLIAATVGNVTQVTMISPDGGDVRYEIGVGANVTRDSSKYERAIGVIAPTVVRARAFVFLRGSELTEIQIPGVVVNPAGVAVNP